MSGKIQATVNELLKDAEEAVTPGEDPEAAAAKIEKEKEGLIKEKEGLIKEKASYGRQREIATSKKQKIEKQLSAVDTKIKSLPEGSPDLEAYQKQKKALGSRLWSVRTQLSALKLTRKSIQERLNQINGESDTSKR